MSCHDVRERLSDLVDDALEAEARAQVDAHLAGCADCRRELDRLRATVSLLRAVERPHAPAGFVDRVLEAARPIPRHRRVRDWLAAVRLLRFPVETAAVVLVASLAVYVFLGTPALRQAARPESPPDRVSDNLRSTGAPPTASGARPGAAGEGTAPAAEGPTESPRLPPAVPPMAQPMPPLAAPELIFKRKAPATIEERATPLDSSARESSEPAREPAPSAPAAPSLPPGAASAPGSAFSSAVEGGRQSATKDYASRGGVVAEGQTSQFPPLVPESVPPPEPRDRMAREKDQPRSERTAPLPMTAARPAAPSAVHIASATTVVGRLTVRNRQAANRELEELLSRVGGSETARRSEADSDTLGLVVPRTAYPAFTQGLARIGAWVPETTPAELPDSVPITLRITQ
jgi:hypothetical protein